MDPSTDIRQWEYIAYCLSQLAFSEKGLKKLIDAFKAYEHALSEDSVKDCFRIIISKCKKFSKPELKSFIEEFEEKLNKFHAGKKEQEETARNAQVHKQKLCSLQGLVTTENNTVEKDTNANDTSGGECLSQANGTGSEESCVSSIEKKGDADAMEVQSPKTSRRGK